MYMDLCVENLKVNKSVPQSLSLLAKIIGNCIFTDKADFDTGMYVTKKRKPTASSIIEGLEQKQQLFSLFFTDLVLYKNISLEKGLDSNGNLKIGWYTHLEHVQIRLSFLEFILANSSLMLSIEQ